MVVGVGAAINVIAEMFAVALGQLYFALAIDLIHDIWRWLPTQYQSSPKLCARRLFEATATSKVNLGDLGAQLTYITDDEGREFCGMWTKYAERVWSRDSKLGRTCLVKCMMDIEEARPTVSHQQDACHCLCYKK